VIVLGEVLVELSSARELAHGQPVRLGFSGDALNSAAASAAAGARTLLVARVPDDELGDALVDHVAGLGVDCSAVLRVPGQHGVYLTRADPSGQRHFFYARRGSVGSQLSPGDVDDELVRSADVVLASGVTCAISQTAAAAVRHAAGLARRFVYDPNLRPRLTSGEAAALALDAVASQTWLVTPSWPDEATTLLGLPVDATTGDCLDALRRKGLRRSVLTCGPEGAVLDEDETVTAVPAPAATRVVDQTGAGDSFVGTVAARVAEGDPLATAVRLGVAAASLSVGGQGGTCYVPSLVETRTHAGTFPGRTVAVG